MSLLERRLGELERRILPTTKGKTREELWAQSMADLIAAFGEEDMAVALGISISELYSGNPEAGEDV